MIKINERITINDPIEKKLKNFWGYNATKGKNKTLMKINNRPTERTIKKTKEAKKPKITKNKKKKIICKKNLLNKW